MKPGRWEKVAVARGTVDESVTLEYVSNRKLGAARELTPAL